MWLIPDIGMSIGAATGVANGGLVIQGITLFPLWGPLLVTWAARRMTCIDAADSSSAKE